MILARLDLELLHRRVLMRAIPGIVLSAALALEIAVQWPANSHGLFWLTGSGLVIGVLAAVIHRWRMESDLLEKNWALDIPWFGIPLGAVGVMASPSAAQYWDVAALVLAARAVVSLQEIVTEFTLYSLLVSPTPPAEQLPLKPKTRPLPSQTRHVTGLHLAHVKFDPGAESAKCPVCADALDGERVRCSSCQTPHHQACFEYNTRCGVYGCGGESVN